MSTMHRAPQQQQKNYLTPNVSSTNVEKPWVNLTKTIHLSGHNAQISQQGYDYMLSFLHSFLQACSWICKGSQQGLKVCEL